MSARTDLPLGVVPGMSFADYLASPAMSVSGLKRLRKSPAHWQAGNDPEAEQKPSLRRGSLLHTMVLEPTKLVQRYITKPDGMSFATREGKAWRDAVPAAVEIVTAAEVRAASRQTSALRAAPPIASLLSAGQEEASFFWIDETTGLPCKGRADWVYHAGNGAILLDLKTCEDASPDGFGRACARYGYHMQAAWYSAGWEAATGEPVLGFVFGAAESTWPHVAQPYMLDDEAMAKGAEQNRELLARYAGCLATNEWPGYSQSIELITLPRWAA